MTSNDFLKKISSFNREGYALWKEKMRIFINKIDFHILKDVKNGPFIPTHQVNDVVVNKEEDDLTKEER